MEDRILDEIINNFYKDEILSEKLDFGQKQKQYNQRRDEIRTGIDSLVSEFLKVMRDTSELIIEPREIRQNILISLDRMNKNGIVILDGNGKINAETVRQIVNEEKKNIEENGGEERKSKVTEGIINKSVRENQDSKMIEDLRAYGLSEEDLDYYREAEQREEEREKRYKENIEKYGEKRAKEILGEELDSNVEESMSAVAVGAAKSGNARSIEEVQKFRKVNRIIGKIKDNLAELVDMGMMTRDEYDRIVSQLDTEMKQELSYIAETYLTKMGLNQSIKHIIEAHSRKEDNNEYNNMYKYILKDTSQKETRNKTSIGDLTSRVIDLYHKNKANFQFVEQEESTSDRAYTKFKLNNSYKEIQDINEINLLVEQGISKEDIISSLKLFSSIFDGEEEKSVDEKIEGLIIERETNGLPLNEIQTAILRNMKKITFDGVTLKDIIEDEERQDELLDKIDSLIDILEKNELPIKDNEIGPVFEKFSEDVMHAGVSQNIEGQGTLLPENAKESEQREQLVSEVHLQGWRTNNATKDIGIEEMRKYTTKVDYKRLYLKFGSKESTEQAASNIGWLATDKEGHRINPEEDKNKGTSELGDGNPSTPPGEEKE